MELVAEAIEFDAGTRDVKRELYDRLLAAPEAHIEAMLEIYAILQLLYDKGILEMVKDLLGSGEKVMEVMTEEVEKNEVVRTVRNLTIFIKIIGSVEPDTLEKIMGSISKKIGPRSKKPPGLLRLFGQLSSTDSRRALEPLVAALKIAGEEMPRTERKKRTRTTRHDA